MNAGYLCKYIIADHRFVGWDTNTRIGFDHFAYRVDFFFFQIGCYLCMVVQNSKDTCQWSISSTFSQSVHSDVDAFNTGFYCFKHVGNSQIVIVMCMKIEMKVGIASYHFFAKQTGFVWIENSQSVGKHEAFNVFVFQRIHHEKNIILRIAHSIRPVFEVDIYSNAHIAGICQYLLYIGNMFLRCFL